MSISSANVTGSLNALQTDAPVSGGQLAVLEAQLKTLFKQENKLALDSTLDAKTKKLLMAGLQVEIQVVMQRIADLKAGKKKGHAPITESAVPTVIEKDDKYKVDVTV
jgi:ABC-type phosphate transport system auxiliary subunit